MSAQAGAVPGRPAGARPGSSEGRPRPSGARRAVTVGAVALLLALAGVANTEIHPAGGRPAPGPNVVPAVAVRSASSTAWYCPGPLPVGDLSEASSVAITDVEARPLRAQVTIAATSGRRAAETVEVHPEGESVVGLRRRGPRGSAAVTVVVDGSGAAVEELVHGSEGVSATPCSATPVSTEYFAAGSTLGANNLSLGVYDPGATPAVVNVSFVTSSGAVAPPAFQDMSVGPGQVVALDVGHYVPSEAAVATLVDSTGGRVVAGTLLTAVVGHALMTSLVDGVGGSATRWLVPAGPAGPRTESTFSVLDPGRRGAVVHLRLGAGPSAAELSTSVPAHGLVTLRPALAGDRAEMAWATLRSSGAPVVVARETLVLPLPPPTGGTGRHRLARRGAPRSLARAAAPVQLPTSVAAASAAATAPISRARALPVLLAGVAVTSGVTEGSATWVLPGGESDPHTSEVVVVQDLGRHPSRVVFERLAAPGGAEPFASLPPLELRPGEVLSIDLADVVGYAGTLPLLVRASRPIVSGELLYGRITPGFTLPAAIAVG